MIELHLTGYCKDCPHFELCTDTTNYYAGRAFVVSGGSPPLKCKDRTSPRHCSNISMICESFAMRR